MAALGGKLPLRYGRWNHVKRPGFAPLVLPTHPPETGECKSAWKGRLSLFLGGPFCAPTAILT